MSLNSHYNIAVRSTSIEIIKKKSKLCIGQDGLQIISIGLIAKSENIHRISSDQFGSLPDQVNELQELAAQLNMDPLLVLEFC